MTIALVAVVAVSLGVTLYAEKDDAAWRVAPKALASAGYLALALASGALDSTYGRWVLAALALGWVGDVALSVTGRAWFMLGLVAFAVSHAAYIGGFLALDQRAIAAAVTAAGLAIPAAAVGRWVLPHVPRGLQAPVVGYIVIITVMVAAAAGATCDGAPWPVLPAAVLFYLSDLLVARHFFVTPSYPNRAVGLPMYYTAQVLFALSVGMV